MIRIGLIGAENSHAAAFASLANLPDASGNMRYPELRVTAIWGETPQAAAKVAAQCAIPHQVPSPEHMLGEVDAVMVLLRRGSEHRRFAMPFVSEGIPTWVDKPFAVAMTDALDMVAEAKKKGTLLAGGSTCKYCPDVLALQGMCRELQKGAGILSGGFNFPGEIDSSYDGIYFYAGHAAEILTTIFGHDVRSVKSDVYRGNVLSLFRYPDFTVSVNFSEVSAFYAQIYSAEKVVNQPIDISTVYRHGFDKFAEALKSGRMVESYESLLHPVAILNALEESIATGSEVRVRMPSF